MVKGPNLNPEFALSGSEHTYFTHSRWYSEGKKRPSPITLKRK
jgi:hypothetical protein